MKKILLFFATFLFYTIALAQNQRISGKVIDEKGETLIGVSVKVKGAALGGSTDVNGAFSFDAPPNATLQFSYVGYNNKEIVLSGQTTLTVTLVQSASQLNELVVVGYGTQKKSQVATAVGSVLGEAIAERGTVSPLQAVQGQVAGVDISAGSGRAGASFNIQIRGQNSLAGGQPLFVVDGVIVSDINFLNPQDIAKMDVLKDAASTAIYGSRGSNGVVMVTTKSGANSKGKGATISYDGYVGVRKVARMPDFMTGEEWWEYRQNTYISPELIAGRTFTNTIGSLDNPTVLQTVANHDYTDWRNLVLQDGTQANHWLTASGKSENNDIQYLIGAGYQNEKGNLLQDDLSRYNFKVNVDGKINKYFNAGMSINYSFTETERGSDDAVRNGFNMAPIFKPYDANGNLVFRPGQIAVPNSTVVSSFTSTVNPLLEITNSENNTRRSYGVGNIYLQYAPADWIDVRSTFSPSVNFVRNGRFWGSLTGVGDGLLPDAQRINQQTQSYIFDNVVNIRKTVKEHSFAFTGLYSMQKDRFESDTTKVNDLPFNSSFYNLGSSTNRQISSSNFNQFTILSYLARLNYAFQNKYFVTLASRWDGSSKLAEGNKWSAFPSAAIAWQISKESFLQNVSFVSDLKLRFSAGIAGNNNNIRPYETQMNLSSPTFYDFGGTPALGYSPSRLPNSSLTWERTREFDLGLDFGLLKNRITGSIDVYDKLSEGLLLNRDLPLETGYTSIKDNIGSVSNKGIEISFRTINVSTRDFSWTTSFTFSRNKNSIVDLLGKKQDLVGNSWFIGQPINVNYIYVFDGIWQENERALALTYGQLPGQAKVKDLNNDGKISSTDDRAIIGQKDPKWTGGFSTQFTYKAFDLSASLFARQGMQVYSAFHSIFTRYNDRGTNKIYNDYYMPANSVTPARSSNTYPQPSNIGPYWDGVAGVGYYKNISFVKVQNISLGYTLPGKLLEKVKIKSLRVYANVLNPFVWTNYDGFDPESASGIDPSITPEQTNNTVGSINNTGPSTITYQFGVNLRF
ncbi:SusC/RagA family TonB-linked outer membrane protein [Pedobacter mucosus]|uniref:SusC/RagA family TonB-linked outer membrane protein n=1 Tax=Pedobacter mucosus TaxID=2895286 RepID=UPI001EE44AC3|nr:TonB-dependent receptor [Pedobacter mucosus]UKT63066.1 TonB-dependent receptor [Pedobacter mucosus]